MDLLDISVQEKTKITSESYKANTKLESIIQNIEVAAPLGNLILE